MIKFKCQNCYRIIEKQKKISGKAMFCSSRCYWDSRKGQLVLVDQTGNKNGNWNPDKQSRTYPSQQLKSRVKERDKNRCYICWSTKDLEVHHTVPFKMIQEHKMKNLITLCHDCHWKIHNKIYSLNSGVPDIKYPNGRYAVWMFQ